MAKTENRLAGGVAGPGPEAAMPDGPESDGGIAGTYEAEGGAICLVYGYHKLAEALSAAWGCPVEDTYEMIDYNTIGSLPYIDAAYRPMVIFETEV